MNGFKFELGTKARDKVTGYVGIIIGRAEWLYGCRRYSLQSQEMKDGKPVGALALDEDAIEVIEAAPPHKMKRTGGPGRDSVARRSDTKR